uniref:AlNc14C806G12530 protein n=1 Tax=Albugo laibachii Nc14 TaxID=890382 RepID=F0X229_9STRA|nr:AlNc14C806G12530 [Albugo laibachii Nc14]|eukprot:CCA27897.1 AlNc14C806G12530 [Albugo laibachii Nc14]
MYILAKRLYCLIELINLFCLADPSEDAPAEPDRSVFGHPPLNSSIFIRPTGDPPIAISRKPQDFCVLARYLVAHPSCVYAYKGFGTDENRLIQAIRTQSPKTRNRIAARYYEMYIKPLAQKNKRKCSGEFRTLMKMILTTVTETEALVLH